MHLDLLSCCGTKICDFQKKIERFFLTNVIMREVSVKTFFRPKDVLISSCSYLLFLTLSMLVANLKKNPTLCGGQSCCSWSAEQGK